MVCIVPGQSEGSGEKSIAIQYSLTECLWIRELTIHGESQKIKKQLMTAIERRQKREEKHTSETL